MITLYLFLNIIAVSFSDAIDSLVRGKLNIAQDIHHIYALVLQR